MGALTRATNEFSNMQWVDIEMGTWDQDKFGMFDYYCEDLINA